MNTVDLEKVIKEKIINHTSKGDQPKWNFNEKWYKADYIGYEALSEFVVSELLKKSNVNEFVSYDLVKIKADEKRLEAMVRKQLKEEFPNIEKSSSYDLLVDAVIHNYKSKQLQAMDDAEVK